MDIYELLGFPNQYVCFDIHASLVPGDYLIVPVLNSHHRDPILRIWVLMFVILVLGPPVILVAPFVS